MKNIGILGSTGSVGKQALDVARNHKDKFKIKFIAAHSSVDELINQSQEFSPEYICIYDKSKYDQLKNNVNTKNILVGHDGLMELCQLSGTDVILNAIAHMSLYFIFSYVLLCASIVFSFI